MFPKNPQVSILISVFNGATTLDKCFGSLKSQTLKNFNVVCVNDASTDNSLNLLKKWKQVFGSRLVLISNTTNHGLTSSLNLGLSKIQTRYTARIDVDDWWDPSKLKKQISFMDTHPDYGVIGCNYINISNTKSKKVILPETDDHIKKKIIAKNPFAHSCVVFKTDLVKNLGGYDGSIKFGQDYDLWLRCLPSTKFYNLQEFLCSRTIGSGISFSNQKEQMLQCMQTQIRYIRRYNLSPLNYFYLLEPLALVLKNSL